MDEIPIVELLPEDVKGMSKGLEEPWYVCYVDARGFDRVFDDAPNRQAALAIAVDMSETDYPGLRIVHINLSSTEY